VESRQRILLYGNSVILGVMGISLRRCPQFEVINLLPPLPEAQELVNLKPDVVFFDSEAGHTQTIFFLLENCPKLLLISVNPDNNLVKVWSGQQLQELSTQGLMKVIYEQFRAYSFLEQAK
jgi:hypothetical protein